MRGCAFCARLEKIYVARMPLKQKNAAMDALFDLAERAARVRHQYGRRKGYHR